MTFITAIMQINILYHKHNNRIRIEVHQKLKYMRLWKQDIT